MKKIAISFIFPLFVGLLFISCLPDSEEVELTSTTALLSFGINDLKTQHSITLENGKDSTFTTIMNASSIKFTIDQNNGLVYNSDSIAYGTDVTHVITKLGADGNVYYYKDGEKIGYNAEDSIDFTNPVKFVITSYDGNFSRDYLISINVHKTDPDKTYWEHISEANFASQLFVEQNAIIRDNKIYVFGLDQNGNGYTTSTDTNDGKLWSSPAPWNGVEGDIDCSSLTLCEETFYILANKLLYHSEDGVHWKEINSKSITSLLAVTSEENATIWGIIDNAFSSSTDMVTWENNGQTVNGNLERRIAYFSQVLRTNSDIHRTIVIATSSQSTDTCAHIWSKLSTEAEWIEVVPASTNTYRCPNLENLAVIKCHNKLYAFGGKSIGDRHIPIDAFSTCYESRDNGVTWRVSENGFNLHPQFVGADKIFSTVVDSKQRVWIIWGSTGEIWRASWNGNN